MYIIINIIVKGEILMLISLYFNIISKTLGYLRESFDGTRYDSNRLDVFYEKLRGELMQARKSNTLTSEDVSIINEVLGIKNTEEKTNYAMADKRISNYLSTMQMLNDKVDCTHLNEVKTALDRLNNIPKNVKELVYRTYKRSIEVDGSKQTKKE